MKSTEKTQSTDGNLILRNRTALESLPEGLRVGGALDLSGCTALKSLPEGLRVGGWLDLRGCTALESLPEGLRVGRWLDLSGCPALFSGVEATALYVSSGDVLDPRFADARIRAKEWFVDDVRVPESLVRKAISGDEFRMLSAEQRRVAVSILGAKWLVDNFNPRIVDMDDHPLNGLRALLRASTWASVYCILACGDPSTGRVYYMEVPPETKTCQEADAYLNHGLDQKRQVGRT
jgi:hypothetical protein